MVDITNASTGDAVDRVRASRPDGIVTFADRRIVLATTIAEELALPSLSCAGARNLVNKCHQRRALAAAQVAGPRFWCVPACASRDRVGNTARAARMPAVGKPLEGNGSRGVEMVCDRAALERYCDNARRRGISVIIEEFLPGRGGDNEFADYLSVESVVVGGVVNHVATTGRLPLAPPFRETGFFIPALLEPALLERVLDLATRAIEALRVDTGCLHTEIKLTPGGPQVIESNGRLGGGIPEMLRLVTDVNLFEIACRTAIGERLSAPPPHVFSGVGYLFYVQAPESEHEVHAIDGLDALATVPGVAAIRVNRPPGSRVDAREGNHGHVFSVLGSLPDHDALRTMTRTVEEKVVITYV